MAFLGKESPELRPAGAEVCVVCTCRNTDTYGSLATVSVPVCARPNTTTDDR